MIVIINDLREIKFYIVAKDELQQFIKNKNIALSEEMQYKGNYETNTKEEIQNVFTDGGIVIVKETDTIYRPNGIMKPNIKKFVMNKPVNKRNCIEQYKKQDRPILWD